MANTKINLNGIRFNTKDVILVTPVVWVTSSKDLKAIKYKATIHLRCCPKYISIYSGDKESLELALENIFSVPTMPFVLDGFTINVDTDTHQI